MMKIDRAKFTLIVLWIALFSIKTSAQPAISLVKVMVSPDHSDWNYKLNEEVKFSVQILQYGNLLKDVMVGYEMGPEMFPEVKKDSIVLKSGKMELKGTMKSPGFYRLKVWAYVNGKTFDGLATAGFEPHEIKATMPDPSDFDLFWNSAISEARKLDLDSRITLLPERCTGSENVYHVSFQNEAKGSRIYGILSVPKRTGKYPAILSVPGAGIRPYNGVPRTAGKAIISLEIGIHGIPVNMVNEVYENLSSGALESYWKIHLNNKNRFYYKRVYLGCVRAIDFIFSLPEFNGTDVAVAGGSQGGALSIVTAALDKRVNCLAVLYPALCDQTGFQYKRAGGWPGYFRYNNPKPEELETLKYFDVVNFARRITIPGIYCWGYNDQTCAPTSMFAAYNQIQAPKELHIFQETGHWTFPEEWETYFSWVLNKQGVKY